MKFRKSMLLMLTGLLCLSANALSEEARLGDVRHWNVVDYNDFFCVPVEQRKQRIKADLLIIETCVNHRAVLNERFEGCFNEFRELYMIDKPTNPLTPKQRANN